MSSNTRQERAARRLARELAQQYKERAKLDEQARARLEVQSYENRIDQLVSLHREAGPSWDWVRVACTLPPRAPQKLDGNEFRVRQSYAIRGADARADFESAIEAACKADSAAHLIAIQAHDLRMAEWEMLVSLAERIRCRDTSAYQEAMEKFSPLAELTELGSNIEFEIHSSSLLKCVLSTNGPSVVPSETKSLTASGKLSTKATPRSRFHEIYQDYVCGSILRVMREIFALLEQRIRDAFNLVNLNGRAFREARILPAYLDARLEELRWTIAAFELRKREREEQRRLKEQIREEERARREYERAAREAVEEEERLKKAMAMAQEQVQQASAQERTAYEAKLAALQQQLTAAEERNLRALSMAQQTKKGNVYIISNLGSFGEEVFKIGMTRRLDPMDRIWELSDASVPFDFDVHCLIACDDAPALEATLHSAFEEFRINKVNYRKEFFRVPLDRIRSQITERGIEAKFTMIAEAREYRETLSLSKLSPAERAQVARGAAQASSPSADS